MDIYYIVHKITRLMDKNREGEERKRDGHTDGHAARERER